MLLIARTTLLCTMLIAFHPGVQAQTLYKSVGPDGRTVYSDQPPSSGRLEKTLKFDHLPSSPVRPLLSTAKAAVKAPLPPVKRKSSGPTLYSATWCGYCKLAKAWLAENKVSYQEVDIDTPEGRAEYQQAGAGTGVPVLSAGSQYVKGFSAAAYEALLAKRPE